MCKDNAEELDSTISSLKIEQLTEFTRFEVLVVDGSLKEDCQKITQNAAKVAPLVSITYSEQLISHVGIYGAMNQGIELSRGEFIWFLNSGDVLSENYSLTRLILLLKDLDRNTLILGRANIILPTGRYLYTNPPASIKRLESKWWRYFRPIHQAMIFPRHFTNGVIFDDINYSGADEVFKLKAMSMIHNQIFLDESFVDFYLGGLSSKAPTFEALRRKLTEPFRSRSSKLQLIFKFILGRFVSDVLIYKLMRLKNNILGNLLK